MHKSCARLLVERFKPSLEDDPRLASEDEEISSSAAADDEAEANEEAAVIEDVDILLSVDIGFSVVTSMPPSSQHSSDMLVVAVLVWVSKHMVRR